MKKILIITVIAGSLFSCEFTQNQCPKIENSQAEVISIKGLKVFVFSYPKADYKSLGIVQNDILNQASNSNGNGWQKLATILGTTVNNMDFNKVIEHMANLTLKQYPNANGIVFRKRMSECEAIKFSK